MKKRAQAQIITTVLLILLVLASIVIVWNLVTYFINESLSDNPTECIEALDALRIDKGETCYIINTGIKLTAKRNTNNIDLTGFNFIVTTDSGSEVFEVMGGAEPGDVEMLGSSVLALQIPLQGESKSYRITTTNTDNIKYLEIAPILGNKKCSSLEKVVINSC